MEADDNAKVGIALLEEVERRIKNLYGDVAALAPGFEYNPVYDVDNKVLQEQLDIAEKKIGNFEEGLSYLNFLRGRLIAIKQSPMGNRTMLKCARYYQEAIEFGYDEAVVRYYWGLHDKAWNERDKAVKQFERVVSLVGINSEIGMEAAKEIEKTKEQKKGGCFIATAVYGSYDSPEVKALRFFRDTVLLTNSLGRQFVRAYYIISPPIARFLQRHRLLRRFTQLVLIQPIARIVERRFARRLVWVEERNIQERSPTAGA